MHKFLEDHTTAVNPDVINGWAKDILVQTHRFPGTNSLVLQASLHGVELAITSSPCIDPRNFNEELGKKYGDQKVRKLATDKLWEMAGIELLSRLTDHQGTDEEFIEKYPEYNYRKIEKPVEFKPVDGLSFTLIESMSHVRAVLDNNVYYFNRQTLREDVSRRVGVEPEINIRDYVEIYLRDAVIDK